MRVLSKYLISQFIKLFMVFEAVFLFLYLVIDFLQKIDNFIEADVSERLVTLYFLYKIPFVTVHMVPPAVAITVIVMVSTMQNRNEVMALKACGVNLYKSSQTLVFVSLCIAVLTFFISEIIVPMASSRSHAIWYRDVEKRDPGLFYGSNQIWYKGSGWIYWIRHFDGKNQIMENPVLYFFDDAFRLIKKIEGRRAVWDGHNWTLEEAAIMELSKGGGYRVERKENLFLAIPETPESFMKGLKKPEEMSYWQLKRYAREVRQEGYDNTRYLVDMNIKTAFPFISVVLVIMGIPIALGVKRRGTPLAVSIGIGVCFLYTLMLGLSRSLGLMCVLPPVLSAWLSNLVFSFAGIYLMMHMER